MAEQARPNRREFVTSTAGMLGGGWLWLQLPAITTLAACARDAARTNEAFTTLTAAEGRAMRAFAARILPSDAELPGAEEAGAVWFVDRALGDVFSGMLEPVRAGLADLDARARSAHGGTFADATAAQQDAIITDIVETPFFFMGRLLTVAGVFADPAYGGNREHAGQRILGMEHQAAYQPPFGWYDEQYARENGGAA